MQKYKKYITNRRIGIFFSAVIFIVVAFNYQYFLNIYINATENKGKDCGEISVRARNGAQYFLNPGDTGAVQTEACALQAYQSCTPAHFIFSERGVDTGSTTTYIIKQSSHQCILRAEGTSYIVPGGEHSGSGDCDSISQDSRGVLITCGQSDLLISPYNYPQIPNDQF